MELNGIYIKLKKKKDPILQAVSKTNKEDPTFKAMVAPCNITLISIMETSSITTLYVVAA